MNTTPLKYEPLRDLVLLRAKRTEEKSAEGIYIPDQARVTLNEGCIVAIGPDVQFNGADKEDLLLVGQTVVFAQHSEWRIEIDDEVYIAVKYDNILLRKIGA